GIGAGGVEVTHDQAGTWYVGGGICRQCRRRGPIQAERAELGFSSDVVGGARARQGKLAGELGEAVGAGGGEPGALRPPIGPPGAGMGPRWGGGGQRKSRRTPGGGCRSPQASERSAPRARNCCPSTALGWRRPLQPRSRRQSTPPLSACGAR